nr:hypothetical protein [Haladaptatus sp. W1]
MAVSQRTGCRASLQQILPRSDGTYTVFLSRLRRQPGSRSRRRQRGRPSGSTTDRRQREGGYPRSGRQ